MIFLPFFRLVAQILFAQIKNSGCSQPQYQCQRHGGDAGENALIAADQFLKAINPARRAGVNRFVVQVTLNVGGQSVGRGVAA